VIKLDIINEVVARTGITKTKAELAVETVFESMKKALAHGNRIELRGFGVFNVRPRKTGIGRNPRTGAEVSIPPGKAVRFKPGKELQSIDCGEAASGFRLPGSRRFCAIQTGVET
jgi:DNA-binding protein HU-beta